MTDDTTAGPIPTDYADRAKGMGVCLIDGGAAFRVWAPHAEAVAVTGTFDNWAAQPAGDKNDAEKVRSAKFQLVSEDNGYWYGQAVGAKVGDEYRFVLMTGEQVISRIDPYARHVTSSIGNGIITDPNAYDWEGDDFTPPTMNELVIYEMHVGTFFDRDPNDGKPAGLADVESKIDHLVHLGVNAVELMPLMEFAGDYSWGYNPAHIFAVESAYGGPQRLRDLVKTCHQHGLAVIIDVVYNHFGPSDLDLWQFDGWSENGKGGIYFYNDWKSSTPWGDTRPDYGRGEVREFIRDNAMMWLEKFHVDGLRYDMTPYMRSVDAGEMNIPEGWSLTHWINTEIRAKFPHAITIAEDLHGEPKVVSTADDGAAFHAQWDNHFVHPIRAAVIAASDQARDMNAVREAVEFSYGDAFSRVIYTESHDEVANGSARVPQEVNDDDPTGYYAQKRSTLGAALVLTSPGLPMIFQGQEFLEGEWFRDTVPLHWDQGAQFKGIFRMYRDLIGLRRNEEGHTKGLTGQNVETLHLHPGNHVYVFHRWADGGPHDDVVVALNLDSKTWGDYTVGMPAAGRWVTRFNSDAKVYSDAFDGVDVPEWFDAVEDGYDGHPASATIVLPPYSAVIVSRV